MKLTINGQLKEISDAATLKSVIEGTLKDSSRAIAELNGQIIKKDRWDATAVKDGDAIELVSFVGGG